MLSCRGATILPSWLSPSEAACLALQIRSGILHGSVTTATVLGYFASLRVLRIFAVSLANRFKGTLVADRSVIDNGDPIRIAARRAAQQCRDVPVPTFGKEFMACIEADLSLAQAASSTLHHSLTRLAARTISSITVFLLTSRLFQSLEISPELHRSAALVTASVAEGLHVRAAHGLMSHWSSLCLLGLSSRAYIVSRLAPNRYLRTALSYVLPGLPIAEVTANRGAMLSIDHARASATVADLVIWQAAIEVTGIINDGVLNIVNSITARRRGENYAFEPRKVTARFASCAIRMLAAGVGAALLPAMLRSPHAPARFRESPQGPWLGSCLGVILADLIMAPPKLFLEWTSRTSSASAPVKSAS